MTETRRLFFTEHLIRQGLVSEDAIISVIRKQREATEPFEELALRLGVLDPRQVITVLNDRAVTRQLFEEICVARGFLTPEQVSQLRKRIEEGKPSLGRLLVDEGVITEAQLAHELKKYYEARKRYIMLRDTLMQFEMFRDLSEEDLESLAYIAQERQSPTGEKVIQEGDPAGHFYCVVSGFLKVTMGETYITMIGPGDVFGESAIFEEERRTANVITESDATLLSFDREHFISFLKNHAQASQHIFVFIIRRLLVKLNTTNRELAFERRNFGTADEVQGEIDELLKEFRKAPGGPVKE